MLALVQQCCLSPCNMVRVCCQHAASINTNMQKLAASRPASDSVADHQSTKAEPMSKQQSLAGPGTILHAELRQGACYSATPAACRHRSVSSDAGHQCGHGLNFQRRGFACKACSLAAPGLCEQRPVHAMEAPAPRAECCGVAWRVILPPVDTATATDRHIQSPPPHNMKNAPSMSHVQCTVQHVQCMSATNLQWHPTSHHPLPTWAGSQALMVTIRLHHSWPSNQCKARILNSHRSLSNQPASLAAAADIVNLLPPQ